MGLLSGLESLGLGKVDTEGMYDDKKAVESNAAEKEKVEKVFDENAMIFDKSCKCPVCDKTFTYRAVKTGKARLIDMDDDLRPIYEHFDPLKYDVIVCPGCGYAAVTKFFEKITPPQAKLVKQEIGGRVSGVNNSGILSYDDAILRHRLALASAIVKKGKSSEKAYTTLKLAWMLRGKYETYPKDSADYKEVCEKFKMDEEEALLIAYEGLEKARSTEPYPIAGMDPTTLDYLLASLAFSTGQYERSAKLVSALLTTPGLNNRVKNKAWNLKERLREQKNNEQNKQ